MPDRSIAAVEQQVKDHGYSIKVKVATSGAATVTLIDSYQGNEFTGTSGDIVDDRRYEVALFIAAMRMLDYQYRNKPPTPKLGETIHWS